MKRKEEVSETMLTEKEASQLSDTEFKNSYQEVHWAHRELPETTGKLQGNYDDLTGNYINMKKK